MNRQTKLGKKVDAVSIGNIVDVLQEASGLELTLEREPKQPSIEDLDMIEQDSNAASEFELDTAPSGMLTQVKAGDFDEDQRTRRDYMVAMQGHKRRLISALSQLYIEATHL